MIFELILIVALLAIVLFIVGNAYLDRFEARRRQTHTLNSDEDSG